MPNTVIGKSPVNRRSFLRNAGATTAAVAALGVAAPKNLFAASSTTTPMSPDTPTEIFTAALVAEDLAITFYYGMLVGGVMTDPNLAGPGGNVFDITPTGSNSNVAYIRAAIGEEQQHSNLFRTLLGRSATDYTNDPYLNFYLPSGYNADGALNTCLSVLEALENAFIGAYLAAIQEFGLLAAQGKALTIGGVTYQPTDFVYYAAVAASILGIESEHRALGRAIGPTLIPANNYNYEQQDGVFTVYNGSTSAVAALTPFLSPGPGLDQHSFLTAYKEAKGLSFPGVTNTIPTEYFT